MANTGIRPDEANWLEYRDVEIVQDDATGETILEIEVRGKRGVGYCKSTTGAVRPFERMVERNQPEPTDRLFPADHKKQFNRARGSRSVITTNLRRLTPLKPFAIGLEPMAPSMAHLSSIVRCACDPHGRLHLPFRRECAAHHRFALIPHVSRRSGRTAHHQQPVGHWVGDCDRHRNRSPRDDDELNVVKQIVARSYEFATGQSFDR